MGWGRGGGRGEDVGWLGFRDGVVLLVSFRFVSFWVYVCVCVWMGLLSSVLRSWVPSLLFFFGGGRGGKRGEEGKAGERYDEDEVDLGRSWIVDHLISSHLYIQELFCQRLRIFDFFLYVYVGCIVSIIFESSGGISKRIILQCWFAVQSAQARMLGGCDLVIEVVCVTLGLLLLLGFLCAFGC